MTSHCLPFAEKHRLQALACSDSAWIILDDQMCVLDMNEGVTRLLGYTLTDWRGVNPLTVLLDTAEQHLPVSIRETIQGGQGTFQGELLLRHKDGHGVWTSATINSLLADPQATQAIPGEPQALRVLVLSDISFTKKFEAIQRHMLEDILAERPLQEVMHHMCVELERIIPSVRVSVIQVDEDGWLHLLAAPSLPKQIANIIKTLRAGPNVGSCGTAAFLKQEVICDDIRTDPKWEGFADMALAAGLRACWSSPILNNQGNVVGMFAFYFDTPRGPDVLDRQMVASCLHLCRIALERDSSRTRIHELAFYDTLTRLPNRAMFNQRAQQTLDVMDNRQALLFFIDLDRFKQVNDSLGHRMGDALLCEIARRLRQCVRPSDILGRLSSDEFAILLPGLSVQRLESFVHRMLDSVAMPFEMDGAVTFPNACVGVCVYPQDGHDIGTLLRNADQAMYAAKLEGSHRWRRYVPEMGERAQERARIENALRNTLEDGCTGLSLHYQPQVYSAAPHAVCGLEALMRWQHPVLGMVRPDKFISVAEDTGLIHGLTSWLLEEACSQLVRWRAQGVQVPHVAINLSTKSFHNPLFPEQLKQTLALHNLHPEDLVLEITESAMLDSSPVAMNNLNSLSEQGMRLSLDDFGTGYSSLSYLNRLPIAELKLDKSFVQGLPGSASASALMRSVLNIGSSLGIPVVAEGVETAEQVDWLYKHGCPILQGYKFSKPLPPDALVQWLSTQHVITP